MDYPNSGGVWTSKYPKRNDKAPERTGSIDIEKDLLLALIDEAVGMSSVKIKLDGWRKKDAEGKPMVSLKVNTYKKQEPVQTDGKDPWDD